jgi:hypothetical protein
MAAQRGCTTPDFYSPDGDSSCPALQNGNPKNAFRHHAGRIIFYFFSISESRIRNNNTGRAVSHVCMRSL